MRIVGIIAARMASTRFPGKPLARIQGIPMIGHVYHRARMARRIDETWVATCDQAIIEYCASIGAPAVMTSDTHERATDRIAEALVKIEAQTGSGIDGAVLVQGDEPMLVPGMLDDLVVPLRDGRAEVANLMSPIASEVEFDDANTVKVVCDRDRFALYFSREPIPSRRKFTQPVPMWKQLGLIAFTRQALLEYSQLAATPLEVIESVDMNRLLEHGRRILMVETSWRTIAVDTPDDLGRVGMLMAGDALMVHYTAPMQGDVDE